MRTSILCLWLIGVFLSRPVRAQTVVFGIDGDWWDSEKHALGFASEVTGSCVYGRGASLQIAESKGAAQTFIFDKMATSCPAACQIKIPAGSRCAEIHLKKPEPASSPSFFQLVKSALMRNPQIYIVAAARGLEEEPQEAVLAITGSELDLSPSLQGVAAGAYTVRLEPLDQQTGGTVTGRVAWTAKAPAKFHAAGMASGLYQFTITPQGGESESSGAWVLVSSPTHYEVDAGEFREIAEIAKSWGDRVDANGKRALLRACLRSLTDRDNGQ